MSSSLPDPDPHADPEDRMFLCLPDPHPDPDLEDRGTDPRIQIRTKMSQIPNTDINTQKIGKKEISTAK
jgi:hypothetical protein